MSQDRREQRRAARRPRALREGLIVREVGDETLVYDVGRHRMHCLAPAMAAVWRACNGRRTPSEIAARVRDAGGAPVDAPAVRAALARLGRARLVRDAGPASVSRRAALRRAAGAGGLALVTLVTPTVAEAASCVTAAECLAPSVTPQSPACKGLPCCDRPGQRCLPKGAAGRGCGCA